MSIIDTLKDFGVEAIRSSADQIIAAIEANRSAILAEEFALFDKYIEPIDIPGVPDAIVDPLLRRLSQSAVAAGLDKIIAELNALKAA